MMNCELKENFLELIEITKDSLREYLPLLNDNQILLAANTVYKNPQSIKNYQPTMQTIIKLEIQKLKINKILK